MFTYYQTINYILFQSFDVEVKATLEELVGKTIGIEQSLLEVIEEEELPNAHAEQEKVLYWNDNNKKHLGVKMLNHRFPKEGDI